MKSRQSVIDELNDKQAKKNRAEHELAEHESVLKSRTEPLEAKIAELRQARKSIVTPNVSPLFIVFTVLFAVSAVAGLVFFRVAYLWIPALAAMGIVLIIRHIVRVNRNRPFEEKRKQFDAQINDLHDEIARIKESDPKISLLRDWIGLIDSKIATLDLELKELAVCEKIGTNCLIICTNNKDASYSYINANQKRITVHQYISHIQIDGQDLGTVASPVSVIPLNRGIHSLTIRFDPNADGMTFTTPPYQFSLDDSLKYFSFKNMEYICTGKDKGFTYDGAVFGDLDSFLSHAETDKAEFDEFIDGLP